MVFVFRVFSRHFGFAGDCGFGLSSVQPPFWIRWRLGELGRERQFFFLPPTCLVNFLPRFNSPLFFLFKMAAWTTDGNIHSSRRNPPALQATPTSSRLYQKPSKHPYAVLPGRSCSRCRHRTDVPPGSSTRLRLRRPLVPVVEWKSQS